MRQHAALDSYCAAHTKWRSRFLAAQFLAGVRQASLSESVVPESPIPHLLHLMDRASAQVSTFPSSRSFQWPYSAFFSPFSFLSASFRLSTHTLIPIRDLNDNSQMRKKGHRSNALRIILKI